MWKYCVVILFYYTTNNADGALEEVINQALKPISPLNPDSFQDILNILPENVAGLLSPIEDVLKKNGITSTYNIKTTEFPTKQVYDFIVIGAGTAGAVVANRLSENKDFNILLLEAGEQEALLNQIPVFFTAIHQTGYNYGYRLAPQENACFGMKDQLCPWPRGKALGGTSSINAMIHTRGNKRDFDIWFEQGNKGWSYEDVLPYFIKSENFTVKDGPVDPGYHGTEGNVCVQNIKFRTSLAPAFLEAGKELGYSIVDYNGANQTGFSYTHVNIDGGARCSSARSYLRVKRSNLDIVPKAFVTKILIDDKKRAYGVEYVKNGQTRTVRACKEVISSAGTINGAQLLMLSGIGPKEDLEKLGIKVIQDAKVGYNMYEHVATWGVVFTTNSTETLMFKDLVNPVNIFKYAAERSGPLTYPAGAEGISFIRTKLAADERPDVELLFISATFASDKGLIFRTSYGISDEHYNDFFKPLEHTNAWTVWPVLQHPKSSGRIILKSKDPFKPPYIDPKLLTHPNDVEVILEGIKTAIKLSQTKAFQRFNSQLYTKKMRGCEKHKFGSDDYFRCAIKTLPVMENHEMGTCKMGPDSDPDAVVDPELRVYGIVGLRVVDASIMPSITTGHINAAVYMIGEKGADLIKEFWENKKSECKGNI